MSFEIAPLTEMRGSEKLQVGFALSLYAEIPMDKAPGDERRKAGMQIKEELVGFVEEAFPPDARRAKTELDPPRTAVLRPENKMTPEVSLTWRIFHADEYGRSRRGPRESEVSSSACTARAQADTGSARRGARAFRRPQPPGSGPASSSRQRPAVAP